MSLTLFLRVLTFFKRGWYGGWYEIHEINFFCKKKIFYYNFVMKVFYKIFTLSTILLWSNLILEKSYAKTTFKGGIITQSKNLETKAPKLRKDLKFVLDDFDTSHLSKILSQKDSIRFERRIGIGAPLERIKLHTNKTRKQTVDDVVSNLKNYVDNIEWPYWTERAIPTSFLQQGLKAQRMHCEEGAFLNSLKTAWLEKLSSSDTPQFERLAIFWLNHFSVNFDMYKQKHAFFQHLKFIRQNANKSYLGYLKGILEDPAMITYLNNEKSYAQNPNENLAREFLELFSLGQGHYQENDIKNLAKHISGNSINFVTEMFHKYNYKTSTENYSAFGKKYKNDQEFFELLKNHPSFGEFIAKKFYKEYVELEEPSKEDLAYLVTYFKKSNFEIPEMVRATLYLKKFWDNKLSLVKSPLDLFYGTARTLNYSGFNNDHVSLIDNMEESGQKLFNPPNIAGWPSGKEWLGGQKLEKRINLLKENFSNIPMNDNDEVNKNIIKNVEKTNIYANNLKIFFDNASNDQLAIETILLGYIPKDFASKKYANIRVYFYNVQFLKKKWKGIELEFGTDKNTKKQYKEMNRFTFYDGFSSPQIITNWNSSWFSEWRVTRGLSSSFPYGLKMERFNNQNKETQKLLYYLLLSMEHVLKKQKIFYNRLDENKDASLFLEKRIREVKKILKLDESKIHTKLFSYPVNGYFTIEKGKYNLFNCGISRYGLNFFDIFQSNTFKKFSGLHDIINSSIDISELLIPDLNFNIIKDNYIEILTHEGYQLK